MAGPCSCLRTWVGAFYLAQAHTLFVWADHCSRVRVMYGFLTVYSCACSESISVLVPTYLTVAHIPQGVLLSIQSSHYGAQTQTPPAVHGYFLRWENYHLCPVRFLYLNVVRFLSFSHQTDNARPSPASHKYGSRVLSLTPMSQSALFLTTTSAHLISRTNRSPCPVRLCDPPQPQRHTPLSLSELCGN